RRRRDLGHDWRGTSATSGMAVCAASAAAGNGTLREGDAELEELGMDAWCTPEGIRRGHAPDQSPDRGVDGRATSGRAAREKRPVHGEGYQGSCGSAWA